MALTIFTNRTGPLIYPDGQWAQMRLISDDYMIDFHDELLLADEFVDIR